MQSGSTHESLAISTSGQMLVVRATTKYPRAGEIQIASLLVSVCGSYLDMPHGVRPMGTRILGHEGVGEVVAVGPK